MILAHEVLDEQTLYPRLLNDLTSARGRIIIYVPYATLRRVGILEQHIQRCVQRRVRVCCFLQLPREWDAKDPPPKISALKAAISHIERTGAHVTMRSQMHEKIVIIDDEILYDGSLNVLSHFDTTERMNRYQSPQLVRDAYDRYKLSTCTTCYGETALEAFTDTFARALRTKRLHQGLTQRQLAQLCALHQSDISQIESGARNLQMSTLETLMDALQLRAVFVPQHLLPQVEHFIREK